MTKWSPAEVIVGAVAILVAFAWSVSLIIVVAVGDPISDDLHTFLAVVGGVLIGLVAHPGVTRLGRRRDEEGDE